VRIHPFSRGGARRHDTLRASDRTRSTLASREAGSVGEPGHPVSEAGQGCSPYVEELEILEKRVAPAQAPCFGIVENTAEPLLSCSGRHGRHRFSSASPGASSPSCFSPLSR